MIAPSKPNFQAHTFPFRRRRKEHLARKAADEAKRLEYERKVKRSLWKIQNAQKVKAFETLREYARMSKRVKRMARRALLERTGYYYQRWREHVLDLIDERVIASETGILVERPTRPVGATQLKLQMQVLKACHSATATGHCLLPCNVFISHSHAAEMFAANTVVSRGADLSTADVRVISSMLKSRALLVYNAPRFRSGGVEALGRVLGGVEGCLSTLSLSDCNLDTRAARVLSVSLQDSAEQTSGERYPSLTHSPAPTLHPGGLERGNVPSSKASSLLRPSYRGQRLLTACWRVAPFSLPFRAVPVWSWLDGCRGNGPR